MRKNVRYVSVVMLLVVLAGGCGKKEDMSTVSGADSTTETAIIAAGDETASPNGSEESLIITETPTPEVKTITDEDLIATAEGKTGVEWLKSLDIDEEYDIPMMVAFQDETGERHIIHEGEEYQLQEGEQLAVYTGRTWSMRRIEPYIYLYLPDVSNVMSFCSTIYVDKFTTGKATPIAFEVESPEGGKQTLSCIISTN